MSAARLYYLEGLSQGEVAGRLGVSRSSVSRMLSDARERGIVEIRIHADETVGRRSDLEEAVLEFTGVRRAVVACRAGGERPIDVVAALAARELEAALPRVHSVGFSWGKTVAAVAENAIVDPIHQRIGLYPLVGGMPTEGTGLSGHDALQLLRRKGGFTVHRFDAPAVVESELTWFALNGETSVRSSIERAASVQLAIVGIGSMGLFTSPRVVSAMHLDEAERAQFQAQSPVGDICGQFYDAAGRVLGGPTNRRIIGISLQQLGRIPEVLGVAAGREKAPGVVGALRTGVLDTVVLEEELASDVLSLVRG